MRLTNRSNLRKERSTRSRVLKVLKPGTVLRADFLKDHWYAVFPKNAPKRDVSKRMGYIHESVLEKVVQSQKTTYEIMHGKTVQSAFGKRFEVKVMLNAETMPDENRIKIIAARVQRESKGSWRQASIEFYLPGLDLNKPAYAVVRFDESGLTEFWTRDTVLYGTKWSKHIQ
ncbi:MAG: hypothetical protein SV487_11015 [Thermodesulfobacteriota bacterium]|nr:hypothetical protein [Thermodesulfobacteriota bacterium]